MARIIRELAQEQNPDKKFNFPDIEFTGTQSGYTDDDDDMDDMDYNKDLRPINRLPPTTSADSGSRQPKSMHRLADKLFCQRDASPEILSHTVSWFGRCCSRRSS